jgi:hypothetical protein
MKTSSRELPLPSISERAGYAEAITKLSGYLQQLEMQKYVGLAEIQNLYNPNSPPGTKKLSISEPTMGDLIIDQRIGTFARLISHAIATLHYLNTQPDKLMENIDVKQVFDLLEQQASYIFAVSDEDNALNKNAIIVLQNFLTEGHKSLADIAGISQKALLQVDDISTFIRPVVVNTHKQGDGLTIEQRFEPISHMSNEQKKQWRDIVTGTQEPPSWWQDLTPHHQARYRQYAQDAMLFEGLSTDDKNAIRGHSQGYSERPSSLDALSEERKFTITEQLEAAQADEQLDAYLTQLLDGDPWFMLAMPKSSGNRYTPLASNHVRIITTTTDNNGMMLSNTTHVRSNEVIIKSDTFKDYPFDYTTLESSPALQYESRFSIFMNALLMVVVFPLRVVAALLVDIFTRIKPIIVLHFSSISQIENSVLRRISYLFTPVTLPLRIVFTAIQALFMLAGPRINSNPDTGRYATVLLFNYLFNPTQKQQQEELINTTIETLDQVYDEFIGTTEEDYDRQYQSFLAYHGLPSEDKHTINGFSFTPILHSASLLSPLPDWIENSVDIGSRFFKSDDNKKMLLYKLAAIEKVNKSNKLMGGAKIRAINFAANDYRRLGISGFGNRIHQHNSHVSTELLQDVLKNTLVALVYSGNREAAKQALQIHNILDAKCKIDDRYDLNRLSETDIQQLSKQIDEMIAAIKNSSAPQQAQHNLSLTLQSVKAYIQLYKKSTENIPENEQILLASYANMMVNGICGPTGRVETHCKSGRDRTFVVQIYEQAMQAYFTRYGTLPLPHDEQANRANFVTIYARLFMQGLAQENSNQNQHGSFGLNNILIQRQRPLCFLAGTADPKNTALLPADILDAIMLENDNITAQNEGQRYNGKHIKPNKIKKSFQDKGIAALLGFSKIAIEMALSPLFAMCVLSSKLFPSVNPVQGGLMGAVLLATGITLAIVFSPVVLPLALTPIVIASSLLALSCLHTLVITNPNHKESARLTQPTLFIPILFVGAMMGLSTLLAPGLALAIIPALVSVILPACTLALSTKNTSHTQQQSASAIKKQILGQEKGSIGSLHATRSSEFQSTFSRSNSVDSLESAHSDTPFLGPKG